MKIKQLVLKAYGPLKDKDYNFKPGFNLLFGPNERGKSLTFDALVKLLVGKDSKNFDQINRVSEDPGKLGGFLSLDADNDNYKLQGETDLSQILDISGDECQNLFLIRNSDLSIGHEFTDQEQFYTSVTDRLTGLKTQQITTLKDQLRDIGQITKQNSQYKDTIESNHLKTRLETAQKLLAPDSKLSKILSSDQSRHWEQLEAQLFKLKQQLKQTEQNLTQQEKNRQLQEYLSLADSLTKIKQLQTELEPLAAIKQQVVDKFRELLYQQKTAKQNQAEVETDLKTKEEQLAQLELKLEENQQQLAKLEQTYQQLETNLSADLVKIQDQLASTRANHNKTPWLKGLVGGGSLLILTLIAYLVHPATALLVLAGALFIPTGLAALSYAQQLKQEQLLQKNLEHLKLELAKHQIKGQNVEQLFESVQQAKQDYQACDKYQTTLKVKKDSLQAQINQLKQRKLPQLKADSNQTLADLDQLKQEHQVKNLAKLQQKLQTKQKIEKQLEQNLAVIQAKLETPSREMASKIKAWAEQIQAKKMKLNPNGQDPADIRFKPKEILQLQHQKGELQQQIESKQNQLTKLQEALITLEKEINQAFRGEAETENQAVQCQSMADLKQLKTKLEQLIKHHQTKKKHILKVIEYLETIEQSDKQKIEELFGQDSNISQHFGKITQSRYTQVFLDMDQNRVKVEQADGQILSASQVSAGTYDQLYFSIRLGLAQKILNEKTGFFIMDDPFIKADQQRLEKQLTMLQKLADKGWQIIYFSAKGEVKDALDLRQVNLIEID